MYTKYMGYTKNDFRKMTYKELVKASFDILNSIDNYTETKEEVINKYKLANWIDNLAMGRNV